MAAGEDARDAGGEGGLRLLEARLARAGDLGVTWGTYVARANGAVVLQGPNGKSFEVPFGNFSPADQQYLKALEAAPPEGAPVADAPPVHAPGTPPAADGRATPLPTADDRDIEPRMIGIAWMEIGVIHAGAGETVLVHAAVGGVGQIMTQWLKAIGAEVIATVGSVARRWSTGAASTSDSISMVRRAIPSPETGGRRTPMSSMRATSALMTPRPGACRRTASGRKWISWHG